MDKILLGQTLKNLLKIQNVVLDNTVFRLHYKLTAAILFGCSIIVTLYQYFGEPIFCVTQDDFGKHEKNQLINTYCWIEGTFTLPKASEYQVGSQVPHPGVSQHHEGDEVVRHAYYQWVCFFLFLQGCMFYVTRLLWKTWEGGKMKALVATLNKPILNSDDKKNCEDGICSYFRQHGGNHSSYAFKYFACEVLNFVHVVGQIYFIDTFLGGEFTQYGPKVFEFLNSNDDQIRFDPMTRVFPRMTKCRFNRYGPSGDVQKHDVLCVLPLNIVNEKIFAILWFWLVILALLSGLAVIYRVLVMASPKARYLLTKTTSFLTPVEVIDRVLAFTSFGDWFVLFQLGANIDDVHYREVMMQLGNTLELKYDEDVLRKTVDEERDESEV